LQAANDCTKEKRICSLSNTQKKNQLDLRPAFFTQRDFWEEIYVSRTKQGIRGGFFTTNCFLFFQVLYNTTPLIEIATYSLFKFIVERREKNNLIKYHLSAACDDIIEYYSTHAGMKSD
jgi:hypothetical protein